jgi:hypothetical protein
MEQSVFLMKEGFSPKNKVLDFLIVHQDFDYSLREIAKYADISYPCMKQLKKGLFKNKWIVLTRKVGKAQMYKLNIKSEKVLKFVDFFWTVVNEEVEKLIKEKNYGLSESVSIGTVSAR